MANASSSEHEAQTSLVQRAISTALVSVHVASSRPAIKAYITTILFLIASFVLLSLSTAAYLFFYYNYIPQIDLTRVIHLQYGAGPHPHATVALDTTALISQQPYDISIELHIPRTPGNLAAGNFMLDLDLLAESTGSVPTKLSSILPNGSSSLLPYTTIASSRRPAILPYSSALLSLVSTIASLPWHMLSLRDIDAHKLSIPMFERISFARGSSATIPTAIRLELQSEYVLQIYSSRVVFHAKFEGLRYLIYNYRVLSFLAFSSVFYAVTVFSFAIAWLLVSSLFPTTKIDSKKEPSVKTEPDIDRKAQLSSGYIKTEPSDSKGKIKAVSAALGNDSESDSDHGLSVSNLSDNAAAFPSIGRQMPLRMPIRQTSSSSNAQIEPLLETQIKTEDGADDEEEGEEEVEEEQPDEDRGRGRDFDSGIGTSMESENAAAASGAGLTRRRSSRH